MKNQTIGKLLWHKAVRSSAIFGPTGNGEVIITVPVLFKKNNLDAMFGYDDVKRRVILAVCNHLFKDDARLRRKGETFATAEAVIHFATPQRGEAIITIKTQHLDVWQWICNQKFAAVNTTKTTYEHNP